jgi:large subunit ribosomal protein L21
LHSQFYQEIYKHIFRMYAIVEIAGQQLKVKKDQKVFVNRLEAKEGQSQEFARVLLIDDEGKVKVGAPLVEGASVTAKVLAHSRGIKVKIFKKRRRKGYQKETGHRPDLTQLQIEEINA